MTKVFFLPLMHKVYLEISKKCENSNRKIYGGYQQTIQRKRHANGPLTYKKMPKLTYE